MSIKICVITPISYLHFGNLGEMDMSLSHLVLENPEGSYAQYYKEQREKGRWVILDNSAFELEQQGKGLDPDPVLDAAEITNPTEVIATDVLFNGPATIESTKRFLRRMQERHLRSKYHVMAVVQGKNINEWLDCFHQLVRLPVNTIGLSKLSIPMSFLGEKESSGCVARSRLDCTETISVVMSSVYNLESKMVHLLGGDNWTPWEMSRQKRYPWIRSNDSSCAVWYGLRGKTFNEQGKIDEIILEKPDLEGKKNFPLEELKENRHKILQNIIRWHMACK